TQLRGQNVRNQQAKQLTSWFRCPTKMKSKNRMIRTTLFLLVIEGFAALGNLAAQPVTIEASNADNSVDPASVTYTVRDKNIFGHPMEVVISPQFAADAGLIAVARRLAKDNAKYRRVGMPVQIYGSDDATRELAEYFNFEDIHNLRITGRDGLVRKIVKFPVSKTVDRELTSKERRAIDEEAKRGAAEAYKALTSGITLPASDATATDKNRADAIAKVERRAASNWIYSEQ